MLTKVEVTSNQGALLSLELDDVSDGLILADVQGLDPVKATLVSSSFANLDGEQYHSSRREARNIKLQIGLEPNYVTSSVKDLRQRLYSFFMPKSEVILYFYDSDGLTVNIVGRVETCESALFTKDPAVDISIMCFEPDFIALEPTTVNGMTVSDSTELLIPYDGSVETGIKLVLPLNRALTQFTIYHRPPDGTLRTLDFAASLSTDDKVTISTIAGAKGATLTRAGSDSSLLYGISPQSNWIELQNGGNYFRLYAVGAGIPYTITYTARYGGL